MRKKPTPVQIVYPEYFGNRIFVPVDNPTTKEGVYLGRMLFYETALSAGDRISCGSCHQQRYAFTDGEKFSRGADGSLQPRNTMSLVNLLWVRHFFWDGRADGLEQQAETPLTAVHEMGQSLEVSVRKLRQRKMYARLFEDAFGDDSITGDRIIKALSQFERTLVSANAPYDAYLRGDYTPTASETNGMLLFFESCGHCHGGAKTFTELFHNNGLDSVPADNGREAITGQAFDKGRFRVVTLRNIALTAPYMHDGRFNTLEEVITHYNEHIIETELSSPFLRKPDLDEQGKKDLLAFLHMLTDSSFITDKRFSKPD